MASTKMTLMPERWTGQFHQTQFCYFLIKKEQKNSVLHCLKGNILLSQRRGYLPLTEYGKHSFGLITRALQGKKRIERCQVVFESTKQHVTP